MSPTSAYSLLLVVCFFSFHVRAIRVFGSVPKRVVLSFLCGSFRFWNLHRFYSTSLDFQFLNILFQFIFRFSFITSLLSSNIILFLILFHEIIFLNYLSCWQFFSFPSFNFFFNLAFFSFYNIGSSFLNHFLPSLFIRSFLRYS